MEPIIKVDNVSMCFNLSTEKHESLKEYLLYSLLPDADFNFPQKPGSQSPALLRGFDAEFVDRIFGSHISVPDTPHSKVNHLPVFKETKCQ